MAGGRREKVTRDCIEYKENRQKNLQTLGIKHGTAHHITMVSDYNRGDGDDRNPHEQSNLFIFSDENKGAEQYHTGWEWHEATHYHIGRKERNRQLGVDDGDPHVYPLNEQKKKQARIERDEERLKQVRKGIERERKPSRDSKRRRRW